jgi:hypothetical protein
MGRRPEDEIQKKLVELELSIKDDEAKRDLPARQEGTGTSLSAGKPESVSRAETKLATELYNLGGWICVVFGLVMFFSHIVVTNVGRGLLWGFPAGGALAFLVVALLVGIGMLFYNYKSRLGQLISVGSLVAIGVSVISTLDLRFQNMILTDFIIMGLPLSVGCALLAKAHFQRLMGDDSTKASK